MSEHQKKLTIELTKFINVYNELTKSNIDIKAESYDKTIRAIGSYLNTTFDIKSWSYTKIKINNDLFIDLSVFNGTKYYNSVENFLVSLDNAFYSNLDNEIYMYLENTTDFSDEEKNICKSFYEKVSDLNKGMKESMFSNIDSNILSKLTISTYEDKLKNFNDYISNISTNKEHFEIVTRFDKIFREIAKNKKQSEIFFDV